MAWPQEARGIAPDWHGLMGGLVWIGDPEVDRRLGCPAEIYGCFYAFDASRRAPMQRPSMLRHLALPAATAATAARPIFCRDLWGFENHFTVENRSVALEGSRSRCIPAF